MLNIFKVILETIGPANHLTGSKRQSFQSIVSTLNLTATKLRHPGTLGRYTNVVLLLLLKTVASQAQN